MAYRAPRFYLHHSFRTAGAGALSGSAYDAAFPRARVIDSALSLNGAYAAAAANQYTLADRGAGFASLPSPTHLIIPAGHNLAGATLEVRHKSTLPASGTDGTLLFTGAVAAGQAVLALSPAASNRYVLVNVVGSGAWSFPELWLTVQRTTTRGPDADWKDSKVPNISRQQLDSGATFRLQRGPDRRQFEFTYNNLVAGSADLQVFLDLRSETQNGLLPFYLDPPDTAEAPLLVELLEPIAFKQDSKWAGSSIGPTYSTKLAVLECLA